MACSPEAHKRFTVTPSGVVVIPRNAFVEPRPVSAHALGEPLRHRAQPCGDQVIRAPEEK